MSGDLLLPSTKCDYGCDGKTRYDPSASQTAVDLNKAFDRDNGTTHGELYSDTVSIASLTVSYCISARCSPWSDASILGA